MLDYNHFSIQNLIKKRGWKTLPAYEYIKEIYNFVRDEILFGYNVDDNIRWIHFVNSLFKETFFWMGFFILEVF